VRLKWNLKQQGGSVCWINLAQARGLWLAVGNNVMMFNVQLLAHAMNAFAHVDIQLHSCLISALHEGEWSASRLDRFTLYDGASSTSKTRAGVERLVRGSTCCWYQGSNHCSSLFHLVALLLWLFYMECVGEDRIDDFSRGSKGH
jgi:hypothetical protein